MMAGSRCVDVPSFALAMRWQSLESPLWSGCTRYASWQGATVWSSVNDVYDAFSFLMLLHPTE